MLYGWTWAKNHGGFLDSLWALLENDFCNFLE